MRTIQLIPPKVLAILSLLVAQYTLGKKAAFPLGIVMGLTAWEVGIVVILSDFALMAGLNYIFDLTFQNFKWAEYLKHRIERGQKRLSSRKWISGLTKVGWLGPLLITSTPFAGGVWTGISLARIMNLSRRQTNLSVGIGVILGCLVFVLAAIGVLDIIEFSSTSSQVV